MVTKRCIFCDAPCGISTVRDVYPHAIKWGDAQGLFLEKPACANVSGCTARRTEAMTTPLASMDAVASPDVLSFRYAALMVERPAFSAVIAGGISWD